MWCRFLVSWRIFCEWTMTTKSSARAPLWQWNWARSFLSPGARCRLPSVLSCLWLVGKSNGALRNNSWWCYDLKTQVGELIFVSSLIFFLPVFKIVVKKSKGEKMYHWKHLFIFYSFDFSEPLCSVMSMHSGLLCCLLMALLFYVSFLPKCFATSVLALNAVINKFHLGYSETLKISFALSQKRLWRSLALPAALKSWKQDGTPHSPFMHLPGKG